VAGVLKPSEPKEPLEVAFTLEQKFLYNLSFVGVFMKIFLSFVNSQSLPSISKWVWV